MTPRSLNLTQQSLLHSKQTYSRCNGINVASKWKTSADFQQLK